MKSTFTTIFLIILSTSVFLGQTPTQSRLDIIFQGIRFTDGTIISNKFYSLGRIGGGGYTSAGFYKQRDDLTIEAGLGINRGVWGTGNKTETFYGICSSPDDQIITAGSIGLENQHDVWVVKMDTSANLTWERSIQTTANQAWTSLISNDVGGAFVWSTEFPNPGQINVHVYNFDASGDTLWTRKLTRSNGDDLTEPQGAYQKSNGNYVLLVGGLTELNTNGDLVDVYGYSTNTGLSIILSDCMYKNNHAYLAGKTFDWGTGASEACLIKIDDNNDVVWAKSYPEFENFLRLTVTDNEEVVGYVQGGVPYLVPTIKVTNTGEPITGKRFGQSPWFSGVGDITELNGHFLLNGVQSYQGATYGYQVLVDADLNSNSCYQSSFDFSSVDLTVNKQTGSNIISYSLASEINYFGTDPITVQVGLNTNPMLIQNFLDGSLATSYNVVGDDCGGTCTGSITMDPSGGNPAYNYLWPDGSTNVQSSGYCYGDTVIVRTGDQSACYVYDTIAVPLQTPVNELCLITVDESSTKNEVVWEKPVSSSIEGFAIYREAAGNYTLVGYVPYDSLSKFIDNTNGVNPNITSYRYKITTLDTCGYESELSDYHETIHLTVNQGVGGVTNLIWDNYEGFSFSYNRIWKDSIGDGNWLLKDSVSSNVFTWTDPYSATAQTIYRIEVVSPGICTSTRAIDHNSTRSNQTTISGPPVDLSIGDQVDVPAFTVFPNPSSTFFTLKLNNEDRADLFIYDAQGRLVKSIGLVDRSNIIEIPELNKGVYVLKVVINGQASIEKLIKK